ncbi:MAG: hypothetical protein R3F26_00025 [Gammaproteobacteria bacterium]
MAVRETLRQMLGMLVLVALLWLVVLYARVLATGVLLPLWGLFAFVMALGLWHQARRRRRVWLHAYLRTASPWVQRLRGGLLMMLWQGLFALCLSAFLLVLLVRNAEPVLWGSLLLTALALPCCSQIIALRLRPNVQPVYERELALQFAVRGLAFLLWLYVLWRAFHEPYPDFRQADLDQALWYMVSSQQARSDALRGLLELSAAADGLSLWLAQHLLPTPTDSVWQTLGWALLLAREALFVWSYLLLCRGMLMLLNPGTPSPVSTDEDAVNAQR